MQPARARKRANALRDAPMLPSTAAPNSKYKPEYCALVIEWGRQGKSLMQCASLLNIDRNTITNWQRDFPDFKTAVARALAHSQHWWEEKAQKSLGRKHFQAQLWRYSMAGRFKEDYAEGPKPGAGAELGLAVLDAILVVAEGKERPAPGDKAKPVQPLDMVLKDK